MLNFKFYNYLKSYQKEIPFYRNIGDNTFIKTSTKYKEFSTWEKLIRFILYEFKDNIYDYHKIYPSAKFSVVGTKRMKPFLLHLQEGDVIIDENKVWHIKLNGEYHIIDYCYFEETESDNEIPFELYLIMNDGDKIHYLHKIIIAGNKFYL